MAIPSARPIFTSYIKCVLVAGKKLNLCLPGSFMTGGKSCSTLFFMALFLPLRVSVCVCVWSVHFYRKTRRNYFISARLLHRQKKNKKRNRQTSGAATLFYCFPLCFPTLYIISRPRKLRARFILFYNTGVLNY